MDLFRGDEVLFTVTVEVSLAVKGVSSGWLLHSFLNSATQHSHRGRATETDCHMDCQSLTQVILCDIIALREF